ncbi:MAG: GPR endopeptidase [Bacilli bacterium]
MKHTVNLEKFNLRTDLIIDNNDILKNLNKEEKVFDKVKVTKVTLDSKSGKLINKKPGTYITIEFDDITDTSNKEKVQTIFENCIKDMLDILKIKSNHKCLIIGLGNSKSTPDALGPITIDNILVTGHLFLIGDVDIDFRNVSAFAPGVTGSTGIETSDLIQSTINTIKPDMLIVIDALASHSLDRVNKTIQISDTGINPGSGIGNSRKEISAETLNLPVIAIGVPTVVNAVTVVSDTINYMHKHYAFHKNFQNKPIRKLVKLTKINYLNKEVNILDSDKKNLLGIVGSLDENEIKQLIFEVLTPIGFNLMVTPKEIDFVIDKLGSLIGNGLNNSLHKKNTN